MSKKPRGILFGGIAFALGLGLSPLVWVDVVVACMVPLLLLTAWNRGRQALAQVAR